MFCVYIHVCIHLCTLQPTVQSRLSSMTNVARKDRDITLTFYAPSVMPTTLNVTFIRSVREWKLGRGYGVMKEIGVRNVRNGQWTNNNCNQLILNF